MTDSSPYSINIHDNTFWSQYYLGNHYVDIVGVDVAQKKSSVTKVSHSNHNYILPYNDTLCLAATPTAGNVLVASIASGASIDVKFPPGWNCSSQWAWNSHASSYYCAYKVVSAKESSSIPLVITPLGTSETQVAVVEVEEWNVPNVTASSFPMSTLASTVSTTHSSTITSTMILNNTVSMPATETNTTYSWGGEWHIHDNTISQPTVSRYHDQSILDDDDIEDVLDEIP